MNRKPLIKALIGTLHFISFRTFRRGGCSTLLSLRWVLAQVKFPVSPDFRPPTTMRSPYTFNP